MSWKFLSLVWHHGLPHGVIYQKRHDVTVYNELSRKLKNGLKNIRKFSWNPNGCSTRYDFIFTCVGNDNDLREVTLGDKGLYKTAKKGSVYVDNTTASANIARELYKEAKNKGFDFLDAPISGGQAGAEGGTLTVMIGGDKTPFKKAEPVIDCYSKKIKLLGPSGSGQLTKMVHQICIAGLVQGISEAINFVMNAGLNMHDLLRLYLKVPQSWQMEIDIKRLKINWLWFCCWLDEKRFKNSDGWS